MRETRIETADPAIFNFFISIVWRMEEGKNVWEKKTVRETGIKRAMSLESFFPFVIA